MTNNKFILKPHEANLCYNPLFLFTLYTNLLYKIIVNQLMTNQITQLLITHLYKCNHFGSNMCITVSHSHHICKMELQYSFWFWVIITQKNPFFPLNNTKLTKKKNKITCAQGYEIGRAHV